MTLFKKFCVLDFSVKVSDDATFTIYDNGYVHYQILSLPVLLLRYLTAYTFYQQFLLIVSKSSIESSIRGLDARESGLLTRSLLINWSQLKKAAARNNKCVICLRRSQTRRCYIIFPLIDILLLLILALAPTNGLHYRLGMS